MAFAKYVLHDQGAVPGRWVPCTCLEADAVWTSDLQVYSSYTDPERELFTVWGQPDGRTPIFASIVLRPRGSGCFHVRYELAADEVQDDEDPPLCTDCREFLARSGTLCAGCADTTPTEGQLVGYEVLDGGA